MDIEALVREKAQAAKEASRLLAVMKPEDKNRALYAMADMLEKRAKLILDANAEDLEEARMKKAIKRSYLDRLMLDESRIHAMAQGLREKRRNRRIRADRVCAAAQQHGVARLQAKPSRI